VSDPLYAKDLLRLAAQATGAGLLEPADGGGEAYNPTCGDRVSVTLRLDDRGRVTEIAHRTAACVLTQASASILGAGLAGHSAADVEGLRDAVSAMLREGAPVPSGFPEYATLAAAAQYRNRHNCVLLPIDAVLEALKNSAR
jgi:nitrogen fixation protein NifU and related proteins